MTPQQDLIPKQQQQRDAKSLLRQQRESEAFEKAFRKECAHMLRALLRRDLPLVFFRDDLQNTVRIWYRDEHGTWYNISNTVARMLDYQMKDKHGLLYDSVWQLMSDLADWIPLPDEMALLDNHTRTYTHKGQTITTPAYREPKGEVK